MEQLNAASLGAPGSLPSSSPTQFEIGLVLAGAISAGAYTAGVIDFLFQALEDWEQDRGKAGVPSHRVVIKVIAGASAGAITGALGAVALARGYKPRSFTPQQIANRYPTAYGYTPQTYQCILPSLYSTWVERPAMVGRNGWGGLLGTADLVRRNGVPPIVRSLLDASLLDAIKTAALLPDESGSETITKPLPYVAEKLHVFLTISNMRGIPFEVSFGRNTYGMQTVGDRVHYVVSDLGGAIVTSSPWLNYDTTNASIGLSVKTLPTAPAGQVPQNWDLYGTTALASGAFPLGLAPRQLNFPFGHYYTRSYPLPVPPGLAITPTFPVGTTAQDPFVFETVDGGLVNNNPFDFAQYALTGSAARPASGKDASQAIVMVAPFPEPPAFPPEGSPSPAIASMIAALFPALVTQARFRASELTPAIDERDYSRYLVAPLRRLPGQLHKERFAIACGLLGGFGGFLDEKFRDHDFQLGRRNCQQFLRQSFHVEADNQVVGTPGGTGKSLPVIPLLGEAEKQVPLPSWPKMSRMDFDTLCGQLERRVSAALPLIVDSQTKSLKLRLGLRFGWWAFLMKRVLEYVRLVMMADLVRRSQIEGGDAPDQLVATAIQGTTHTRDDVQAILAELIEPAYSYRTPARIAAKTRLPETFVAAVLSRLSANDVPEEVRAFRDEAYGYTIFWRRPTGINSLGPVRWFNRWWDAPTVN